ncbi:MAG: hypothetical protein ACM34J_07100 [Ignavibacteria bacterium]
MIKIIRNGGLEEGLLEMAEKEGLISEKDKIRLAYLKSLPRDRIEVDYLPEFKIKETNSPPGRD